MKNNYLFLDFEFNNTKRKYLNLVCCSILVDGITKNFWLHNSPNNRKHLRQELLSYHEKGYIFVSYNVQSEARSIISLFKDDSLIKKIKYLKHNKIKIFVLNTF